MKRVSWFYTVWIIRIRKERKKVSVAMVYKSFLLIFKLDSG
jgi:hypothetical protein